MAKRIPLLLLSALVLVLVLLPGIDLYGQQAENQADRLGWRSAAENFNAAAGSAASTDAAAQPLNEAPPATATINSTAEPPRGFGPRDGVRLASAVGASNSTGSLDVKLPCTHGQIWREYDISPYTLRVTSTKRPEKAVVDWILRETGYEAWHATPLGILSATPRKLLVYHTPQMQALVGDVVDRFVAGQAATHAFSLRVVSLNHPNWREKARRGLQPMGVQTPGVQAWVMQKEDASALLAELRRRSDFREHSSPHLLVNNGQSAVVSSSQSQTFVRDVTLTPQVWPGFEQQTSQFDEDFSLEFTPLLSVDGATIDASLKCSINQLEKLVSVMIDAPTPSAPRQRAKTEVPQTSHFRFHERFRWPTAQVLLISMGMVALPASKDKTLVPGIPLPFGNAPGRADVLVFIESRGQVGMSGNVNSTAHGGSGNYLGRY